MITFNGNGKYYSTRVRREFPVGSRWGRLVVRDYTHTVHKGYTRWSVICDCDCGSTKTVDYPKTLRAGLTKSCGCLNKELASNRRKGKQPIGALPFGRATYTNYRRSASLRGLPFTLDFENFCWLIKQNCTYCGIPPRQRRKIKRTEICNGVDRLSPKEGYVTGNVVPCCKECNRAKGALTVDEFVAWIERLVSFVSN